MKRFFGILAIVLLIVIGVVYSWTERIADGRNLPASNSVKMNIASGGVTINGVPSNDYRVTLDDASPELTKRAKIEIDREHQPVIINLSQLPQGSRVRVEVPESSNIAVTMGAGELQLHNIHGSKYAMLRSGKLLIDIGSRDEYSKAEASVLAGALHAPALDADKGGVFRCLKTRGSGKLALDAHVSAGELVLQNGPAQTE